MPINQRSERKRRELSDGLTASDIPGVVNRVQLLLRPRIGRSHRSGTSPASVRVIEYWRNSPKGKLSGRLTVTPVAQVKVEEYRVFPRFLLQVGNGALCLGNVGGSQVDGRIAV